MASTPEPTETWRDVVSTFWNTVDTIGVAAGYLPLRLRLGLRCVGGRWNLAVRDSVQRLKCKSSMRNETLGMLLTTFREVQSLSLAGCGLLEKQGWSHLALLGALTTLDVSNTAFDFHAVEHVAALPRLTSLSMVACHWVPESGFAKLCAMTQLRSLDVRRCHLLSSLALERFSAALSKLESLSIEGRHHFPDGTEQLPRFSQLTSLTVNRIQKEALAYVCKLTCLTSLDVSLSALSDAGLASVCNSLPHLASLSLREAVITDVALEDVSRLSSLTSLVICKSGRISEAGIAAVSRMAELTTLRLGGAQVGRLSKVTDAWLVHIAKLVNLTELDLHGASLVTDVGVQSLAPLAELRSLDLSGIDALTDACTSTLGGFVKLRTLKLRCCTKLTDAGLEQLAPLTRLTKIDLCWAFSVSDAGVAALSRLPSLGLVDLTYGRSGDVGGPRVSRNAVASLCAAVPGVEVLAIYPQAAEKPSSKCVAQ